MFARSIAKTWGRPTTLAILLILAGCAGLQQPQRAHLDAAEITTRECAQWFEALDATVSRADVDDIAARRIAGFPYLRIDRFAAAFRAAAIADDTVRQAWIEQLRALDADGRRIEIDNLPSDYFDGLAAADRERLRARTSDCAAILLAIDADDESARLLLAQRARVEDDYSSWKRALGLYELTRFPFHAGVENWQRDAVESIRAARRGEPARHPMTRFTPPQEPGFTRAEVRALLARAARHPLGLAQLTAAEKNRLFASYAPVFEIETGGDYDRIGKLHWTDAPTPQVDTSSPTVYRRIDYTRMGGQTLMQLVYVAWLPERPRDHAFDLLGGELDGIVWRVTLAADGEPVLYDSIHPCGCYHMFFPTPRVEPIAAPERTLEWAFVPAKLPRLDPTDRMVVSLQSRTHYLRNVWPGQADTGTAYRFADYDELRALPLPTGGSRSIFGPDGLVAGSERRERFIFWPMGIDSAGAMRQAGTQATAFVGRRHFDDADLIEKRFRLLD